MKTLSVAGTAAMFLVGGGILVHGIPALHHDIESLAHSLLVVPTIGPAAEAIASALLNGLAVIVAGAMALGAVLGVKRLMHPSPA